MSWDAIVIGAGGIGSATLDALARRGGRVLGIDRFAPPHDRGSSYGETRIFRKAYMEHPDYVPLARRSEILWRELEERTETRLLHRPGLLQVGPSEGPVIRGVRASATEHALDVDELGAPELRREFPGFSFEEGSVGLFERDAGYLEVEACIRCALDEAEKAGARLAVDERVLHWDADRDGVSVETDRARYRADRLIVAAGAWAPELLAKLGVEFEVRRKVLLWYRSTRAEHRVDRGMPTFLIETTGERLFYGFPVIDGESLKVAEHTGGVQVGDPLAVDREVGDGDRSPVEAFCRESLPGVTSELLRSSVCLYTMTPDEHFVVDRHPSTPQVVIAAGLSGHGFKFAPALGEALADLALEGRTSFPVEFLSLARFPGSEHRRD